MGVSVEETNGGDYTCQLLSTILCLAGVFMFGGP